MILYDLVNDDMPKEEIKKFFDDPEQYGTGDTAKELNENIQKVFNADAEMNAYFRRKGDAEFIKDDRYDTINPESKDEINANDASQNDMLVIGFENKFDKEFKL
jgi:hypothetical protein